MPASPGALGEGRLPQTRTPTCSGQVRLLAENLPAPELSTVGVGNRPAATGLASNEERGANPGRQRPAGRPVGTRAAGGGPSEKEPGAREGSFWNVVTPRDLSLTGGPGDRVGGSDAITQATRSPFSKPSPLRPALWPGDTETFQSLLLASRPDIGPGASVWGGLTSQSHWTVNLGPAPRASPSAGRPPPAATLLTDLSTVPALSDTAAAMHWWTGPRPAGAVSCRPQPSAGRQPGHLEGGSRPVCQHRPRSSRGATRCAPILPWTRVSVRRGPASGSDLCLL